MRARFLLSMLLVLAASPARAEEDCHFLPDISEETGAALCPAHYLMSGLACLGNYCDNVRVKCCRYKPSLYSPTQSNEFVPSPGHPPGSDERFWTDWFSEEGSGRTSRRGDSNAFISGMQCRGDNCDEIRLRFSSPAAVPGPACAWRDPVFDGDRVAQCPTGFYVNNVKCVGRYCDGISLQCCNALVSPGYGAFTHGERCLTLPATGRGFSVNAETPPSGLPADLNRNPRPDYMCPSGYAVRGLRCRDSYCSRINATCCLYGADTAADAPAFRLAPAISEEPPSRSRPAGNRVASTTEFMTGIRCSGNYCDNVEAVFMAHPRLINSPRTCQPIGPFSEEQVAASCPSYQFLAGIECEGKYCDQMTLTCCNASFLGQ